MAGMSSRALGTGHTVPEQLRADIEQAGYYPAFVTDVVGTGLGGEAPLAHLVHQETTFDAEEIRRHVTVLVVTATRLVAAHADDHGPDANSPTVYAQASSEGVPLSQVRTVVLQYLVSDPAAYRGGDGPRELTLTVGWGSLQRIDLEPATCGDPQCEGDHGYTGAMATDDIVIRVSADAEGGDAVAKATEFARVLSAATGQRLASPAR
jgi:hypothetical protein